MARRVLLLGVLCAAAFAQEAEPTDLEKRIERLEQELARERARGREREKRVQELERALERTTENLARSQDRRLLEEEIEAYLEEGAFLPPAETIASRLNIGAVLVNAYRATWFTGDTPNPTNTFRLEERYLRFVYRFSETVTARYYTDGSLTELEYRHSELLQLNFGVVVVPFGQFNPRSFPDTFDTLSRPLLYLGDDDVFQQPANNPTPVFRSIYSDTGLVVSGSRWSGQNQLYYAVFVVNGLTGVAELGEDSTNTDNNDDKEIGARVTYTAGEWIDGARFGFGISWMRGKFDPNDRLSFRMYGADFVAVFDGFFGAEGSLTVRAEYVYATSEILYPSTLDPNVLINDAQRVQGAYVIVEARLNRRWMAYVQGDWMQRRGPLLVGAELDPAALDEVTTKLLRGTIGLVRKFAIGILWKFEYGYWDFDEGAPDAHRISTQIVIPF